jgi:hypothetical protein
MDRAALDLELRPNRPDVLGSQRRFCSGQFSLVPRDSLGHGQHSLDLACSYSSLGYRGEKHEPPGWALDQVGFRGTADFKAARSANALGRMTAVRL